MIADNVQLFLANKLFYKRGVDIFVNHYDVKRTEAIIVYDTGSVNIENYVNLDQLTIQIIVVSKSHNTAKKQSIDIYHELNRKQGLEMDGKTIKFSKATQTPYSLGKENGVYKISTNYVLMTCL